jgi:hypothetical protein
MLFIKRASIGYPSWVPKFDYSFTKPDINSPSLSVSRDQAKSQWKVKVHSILIHASQVDTISIIEKVMVWSNFDVNHYNKSASGAFIEMWK